MAFCLVMRIFTEPPMTRKTSRDNFLWCAWSGWVIGNATSGPYQTHTQHQLHRTSYQACLPACLVAYHSHDKPTWNWRVEARRPGGNVSATPRRRPVLSSYRHTRLALLVHGATRRSTAVPPSLPQLVISSGTACETYFSAVDKVGFRLGFFTDGGKRMPLHAATRVRKDWCGRSDVMSSRCSHEIAVTATRASSINR